jgi:hypothetical protein
MQPISLEHLTYLAHRLALPKPMAPHFEGGIKVASTTSTRYTLRKLEKRRAVSTEPAAAQTTAPEKQKSSLRRPWLFASGRPRRVMPIDAQPNFT